MATSWIVWGIAILVSFTILETYAFDHPNSQWSLSRSMAWLGQKWPLSIGLYGMVVGGLAVHFFWHFSP